MSLTADHNGESGMLIQALALAARGWRVLPVEGKIPLLKEWPRLASTDADIIGTWWHKRPTANIGIATGKASGLFVLDVDPGKGGDESLRSLEKEYGTLPDTVEVLTGGGGRHYYFQHPGTDIGNSASALGAGLDVKTDGGQVVAPPSIHPTTGRPYEWEAAHHPDDVAFAPVPSWLLQRLTVTSSPGTPFVIPATIRDGERNEILYKTARSLKAKGLCRTAVRDALHSENREKCDPPMAAGEVEDIVEHTWTQPDRPAFVPRSSTDATPPVSMEELDITESAGIFTVRAPIHGVSFLFERLTDSRGGVQAELTVTREGEELLAGVDVGLKSDTGQSKLAISLKAATPSVQWKVLLQKSCSLVLKRHRHGEPIITLAPSASAQVPFLLNPLIYKDHQTLMFAPGGTCKSYLALWFALLACHGAYHAGIAGIKTSVLYLDWELNAETVGGRLKALQAGHPDLCQVQPYYRRCELPLHQEAHQIAAQVAERAVTLVIVDSAAMACGGELNSPEAAITLQRALRKINCASLVLAHTSKSVQEGQDRTAYGTVFFRELARNQWEVTKADDENPVKLALSQTKNNFGSKHPPLGVSLTFSSEKVRVDSHDLAAEPAFQTKLPTPSRIRNLLEDGTLRTSREIAEELGLKLGTVKSALSRGKGHKWQQIGEDYRNPQWTVLRAK